MWFGWVATDDFVVCGLLSAGCTWFWVACACVCVVCWLLGLLRGLGIVVVGGFGFS